MVINVVDRNGIVGRLRVVAHTMVVLLRDSLRR